MEMKQRPRGAAAFTQETRQRVAKLGGQAVVQKYGRDYFSKIGKLGGTSTSRDRVYMSEIGRVGGLHCAGTPKSKGKV
jgi:general stress protein YciG